MLIGHVAVWQNASIPSALSLDSTEFAQKGVLASYADAAHGYQPDGSDVYNMSALSGWTCGNILTEGEMSTRVLQL